MDREFLHLIDSMSELIPSPIEKLSFEELICECFCISAGMIREVCPEELDLDLLEKKLNLGNGCRGCIRRKEDWIYRI